MTDDVDTRPTTEPSSPYLRGPATKSETVIRLLSRNRGATLAEIMAVTHWQPHSVRAFLTGLRKKGRLPIKEARKSGETSYRLED